MISLQCASPAVDGKKKKQKNETKQKLFKAFIGIRLIFSTGRVHSQSVWLNQAKSQGKICKSSTSNSYSIQLLLREGRIEDIGGAPISLEI